MSETFSNGVHQENVDVVLRAFFSQEMPAPWPEVQVVLPMRAHAIGRFRPYRRMVVAASMLLILVGYLTLASKFPVDSEPESAQRRLNLKQVPTIGSKPGLKQRVPIPRGGEALLWEERIPGGTIIHVEEIKGPRHR